MTIKRNKLPTLLGLVILVAATFLGVFLLNGQQIFRLGASGESSPKDIRTSNITDTSLTISWSTDKAVAGFINWGISSSSVTNIEKENDEKSFTHSVTVNGLSPEKIVYFKINSDGSVYDNKGIPWQISTGPTLGINKSSILLSGSIIVATGEPVRKALVYANVGGYLFSTLTSDTGNYVFQLANTRTQDLSNYLTINESQTLVEIFVQAPPNGVSSAQIFPQSGKSAPAIIIGQTHDFRSLPASVNGDTPNANPSLPGNTTNDSKFSVSDDKSAPSSTTVTLENIENGESVTSTKPEFFGQGPKGETLSIKVESENPITEDVKVASDGSWKWTPPEGLAAGLHKITITWRDASGITRSLTRNFVVQAGEAPAFEASPSESLAASSTPSPSASASSTPVSTIKATAPPTPVTGSLTPTLLFSILGLGVIALSFAIWKYSNV